MVVDVNKYAILIYIFWILSWDCLKIHDLCCCCCRCRRKFRPNWIGTRIHTKKAIQLYLWRGPSFAQFIIMELITFDWLHRYWKCGLHLRLIEFFITIELHMELIATHRHMHYAHVINIFILLSIKWSARDKKNILHFMTNSLQSQACQLYDANEFEGELILADYL